MLSLQTFSPGEELESVKEIQDLKHSLIHKRSDESRMSEMIEITECPEARSLSPLRDQ